MRKGQVIDILGPLGRQFEIPKNKKVIIAAGGIGIAPVSFLSHFIIEKKVPIIDNIEVVWGVKTERELVVKKELESIGVNLHISTEDGTCGEKGICLSSFLSVLEKEEKHDCAVYASGSLRMLKEISKICKKRKIPAQVSCESIMACGVGACMGCVIKTEEGFKKVCKDGPVFDAGFIKWD
jgi:dihydroorotate dehydrogenase electron transfer subunit